MNNSYHKFRAKIPSRRSPSRPGKKEQEGSITKENERDADETPNDEKRQQSENWSIVHEKMINGELDKFAVNIEIGKLEVCSQINLSLSIEKILL